ncbi:DUF4397 domain-containing protein [Colwellia sp. MEBiC06753]
MFKLLSKPSVSTSLVVPIAASLLLLSACDSGGSSDDSTKVGYVQFYNASANAPEVYLTIDEDLDEDDDDEIERTYSAVSYGSASSRNELEKGDYYAELGWQSDDSSAREDLTQLFQEQIEVTKENINFLVLAEDITAPAVFQYSIPVIDDDNDASEDLFNIRFLNLNKDFGDVDIYISQSDETFNEAELIDSAGYSELTVNHKFGQDEYTFYITAAGSEEVVFVSEHINFQYTSQYVLALRENVGIDTTPFTVDLITSSSTYQYQRQGSAAQFRAYNGILLNDLLPDYQGNLDIYSQPNNAQADISQLAIGQFSSSINTAQGDYSFVVKASESEVNLLKNHLVTLTGNIDKTVFFYASEEYVDEDGDGNVDEDNDGIVDEIEITVNSLVVKNSTSQAIYQHNVSIVNLVDDPDFSSINVYFVRSDELIESAEYKKAVPFAGNDSLTLLNNTYQVFVVAKVNSSDMILAQQILTLDEDSDNQFVIVQQDPNSASGYSVLIAAQ